jgi:hypothetical protein
MNFTMSGGFFNVLFIKKTNSALLALPGETE